MKKLFLLICIVLYGFPALAQKQAIKVIYIGDSITAGAGLDNAAAQAPPAAASRYLQQQPGISSVRYVNQGHSGFTTVDFLPGGTTFAAVEKSAADLNAGPGVLIFSIMLGTNDSAMKGTNGAPVTPAAYAENLKKITDRLLNDFPGSSVIINLPIWYSPNTYNGAQYLQEGLDRLQSYFKPVKALVNSYHHRVFLGDTQAFGYFKAHYITKLQPENGHQGTFYLHPNKAGAADLGVFWGKAIYAVISAGKLK
ncbi:MAG TPA: GDSL-type esterase/lipase family protein [Mucilaginibacter sp.]|nr:GDSL-type esterase/lipase family protein [Mucilaginibacter sp.]